MAAGPGEQDGEGNYERMTDEGKTGDPFAALSFVLYFFLCCAHCPTDASMCRVPLQYRRRRQDDEHLSALTAAFEPVSDFDSDKVQQFIRACESVRLDTVVT
jgi:hypothetical protein